MDDIRILDLADPRLDDVQRAALGFAESRPVSLTVDAVLDAARQRAGLDDFGDPHFEERLAAWLAEVDGDHNRTALGRAMFLRTATRYATTRLRLVELWRRFPEIDDERIESPVVVVGLPRSGTTHLLNLISSDPRLQCLPLWESYEPVRPEGVDHRRERTLKEHEQSLLILPHQQALHPMDPDHSHEEIELQGSDFGSYIPEWIADVPAWRDRYYSEDQTPRYAWMLRVLKAIQWQRGDRRRWVLKSPQHLEQLGPLMTTFPDASVVVTHRDPLSVIQSAATMIAYSGRLTQRRVDPSAIFDYWFDRVDHLLAAFLRDRALLPEGRTTHVRFDEFMADQIGTLERIYSAAGLSFEVQRRRAREYVEENPRSRVVYDVRADFGADPDQVRTRFTDYLDAFGVRTEVR